MKKMKNKLNDEMGYFKGMPKGTYCEVLDEMMHTKVNSSVTSSIPLAEFWQPDNLVRMRKILNPHLAGLTLEKDLKFFEMPVDPIWRGKVVGRPSMSDLYIEDANWQVAVEGKYTEYARMPSQTIFEWLSDVKAGAGFMLRLTVARAWLSYIHDAGCTDLGGYSSLLTECKDVCYQFLHRTASACFKAKENAGKKPVLIYQLFFNAGDKAQIASRDVFIADLKRWAKTLKLKSMKFLIVCVPVKNAASVAERYGNLVGQDAAILFDKMKLETIYDFDFDGISVEDVLQEAN